MSDRDLQRWSREVAEDPGAPSFVRLARAYRRQGRRAAAREVVVRGLERNPEHIEAHSLLALIQVEDGDREQARDEWETVLRLAPGNFDASRGLGFLALERNDLDAARRHLDAAARARPDDSTVAQAREVLQRRADRPAPVSAAGTSTPPPHRAQDGPGGQVATAASLGPGRVAGRDPGRLFEGLEGDAPFLGALVLDEQGLVLAGSLVEGTVGTAELLGALLNGVVEEAHRTAELLRLGEWEGLLVDCEQATLHVAPLQEGAVIVVVAPPRTPAGWVVRAASQAGQLAHRFMEAAS